MKNAFNNYNNYDNNIKTSSFNYVFTFDKFALKVLNWLFYNQEISRPLVTSYLLNWPNHYFPKKIKK